MATTSGATTANALEERNEALCRTGFFTNIAQYYCTDIGNIADEGRTRGLSANQEGTTDSLLSKFSFEREESDGGSSGSDGDREVEKTEKRRGKLPE